MWTRRYAVGCVCVDVGGNFLAGENVDGKAGDVGEVVAGGVMWRISMEMAAPWRPRWVERAERRWRRRVIGSRFCCDWEEVEVRGWMWK